MSGKQLFVRLSVLITATASPAGCITYALPEPVAIAPQIGASTNATPVVVLQAVGQVAVSAPLPTNPISPDVWHCEWFANRNLLGAAAYTNTIAAALNGVQFDWAAAPLSGALPDGVSMRCVRRLILDGPQNHRFDVLANGGLRFFVDDQPIYNQWRAGEQVSELDVPILARKEYVLRLEYYNTDGRARASLAHVAGRYNAWRGFYYNEPNRVSTPIRQSNDGLHNDNLILNWGSGAPAGVNPDNFSAIWEQTIETRGGTYRFWGDADDELKIYVDRKLLYDNGGKAGLFDKPIKLSRGFHLVEVHYAEYGGEARMVLQWERVEQ